MIMVRKVRYQCVADTSNDEKQAIKCINYVLSYHSEQISSKKKFPNSLNGVGKVLCLAPWELT